MGIYRTFGGFLVTEPAEKNTCVLQILFYIFIQLQNNLFEMYFRFLTSVFRVLYFEDSY